MLLHMAERTERPFYGEFAWAFDLLIDRPVAKDCAAISKWLIERGHMPGATLLDAGCGTGRYAIELSRRGYVLTGIDRSSELIDVAIQSARDSERPGSPAFRTGDILRLPTARYDAILCRGVLNDLVDDASRLAACASFAGALRTGGTLILDVREWEATKERKQREPLFRKRVATDRGTLTFTSITDVDPESHRLLVSETHTLDDGAGERSRQYQFTMRCWTRRELHAALTRFGFGTVAYFGAFDPAIEAGATDRLIAVACLTRATVS